MPIYEFVCPVCGERFEELSRAGTQTATCPVCGAENAGRVLSTPAPTSQLVKSPGQARRMEDKRGTGRGGAMERFRKQRAKEKRSGGSRG